MEKDISRLYILSWLLWAGWAFSTIQAILSLHFSSSHWARISGESNVTAQADSVASKLSVFIWHFRVLKQISSPTHGEFSFYFSAHFSLPTQTFISKPPPVLHSLLSVHCPLKPPRTSSTGSSVSSWLSNQMGFTCVCEQAFGNIVMISYIIRGGFHRLIEFSRRIQYLQLSRLEKQDNLQLNYLVFTRG